MPFQRAKCGTENGYIALYIHIYIYIYGPHLISWADILHFWHFSPSFIVKNAPILQPTNCGCKLVFLFSSSSLLLPFSALLFFFLCFYQSQSLNICPPIEVCGYIYIYACRRVIRLSTFWPFRSLLACPPLCRQNLILTAARSKLKVISLTPESY